MDYSKPLMVRLNAMSPAEGAGPRLCYPGTAAGEVGEACVGGGAPGYTVCTGGMAADNTIDCAAGTADDGNCLYGDGAGAGGCTGGNGGSPDSFGGCRVGPTPAF